jgi:hypothetical protein
MLRHAPASLLEVVCPTRVPRGLGQTAVRSPDRGPDRIPLDAKGRCRKIGFTIYGPESLVLQSSV